jgi:hypothetical protein
MARTGVIVEPKIFLISARWLKTFLSVDGGEPKRIPPGETFFPLLAGRHILRCFVSYLYHRHLGDSTIEVDVPNDGVVTLPWKSPKLVFLSGKWKVITSTQRRSEHS